MNNENSIKPRFNLLAHDRDGILTIEIIGQYYQLRRKPNEVLSDPLLAQGFPPEQLAMIQQLQEV